MGFSIIIRGRDQESLGLILEVQRRQKDQREWVKAVGWYLEIRVRIGEKRKGYGNTAY